MGMAIYLLLWYSPYMAPKPWPRLGPTPTPITEYLAKHPEASMMSIAKACGVHYDTIHKAEQGKAPPFFITMLKLQEHVGIPVMAWAATRAVRIRMERRVSPQVYRDKAERWRKLRRKRDPEFAAKDQAKVARSQARQNAKARGEEVPPVPMSPLKARLLGVPQE